MSGAQASAQMKYKIVFLGDQSVGKTSIILRFTQDSFDVKYQVSSSNAVTTRAGHNRNRLSHQDRLRGRQDGAAVAVGHCWPGALPLPHSQLHQRQLRRSRLLRHHLQGFPRKHHLVDQLGT